MSISSNSPSSKLPIISSPQAHNLLYGADLARVMGCMMVLFCHLTQRINFFQAGPELKWMAPIADNFGNYGVVIFFVLSGFLLSRPFWRSIDEGNGLPKLSTYFFRRLARIAPAYWFTCILCSFIALMFLDFDLNQKFIARFLSAITFISPWHEMTLVPIEINAPLWSISFETTAYFLLPLGMLLVLFLKGARSKNRLRARWLWCGVMCLSFGAHYLFVQLSGLGPIPNMTPFTKVALSQLWFPHMNPFGFFTMFGFGVLAAGLRRYISQYKRIEFDLIYVLALVGVVVIAWLSPTPSMGGAYYMPYRFFPALPILIAIFLMVGPSCRFISRIIEVRLIRWISTISYGIYIYHYIFLELFAAFIMPSYHYYGTIDSTLFWQVSFGITALSLLCAHLSWIFIERPCMNLQRKLEKTKQNKLSESLQQ